MSTILLELEYDCNENTTPAIRQIFRDSAGRQLSYSFIIKGVFSPIKISHQAIYLHQKLYTNKRGYATASLKIFRVIWDFDPLPSRVAPTTYWGEKDQVELSDIWEYIVARGKRDRVVALFMID